MRLPNGYGSCFKMPGNRRKPYIVQVPVNGNRITLGYYATKQEGLQALAAYNENPYDLSMSKLTFAELYQRWYAETFNETSSPSTVKVYAAAYKRCALLYQTKMSDLRPHHMQQAIDDCPNGYQSKKHIHILFNQLYKWCMMHDCLKKNYAEWLKINEKSTSAPRNPFTSEEIAFLWQSVDKNPYVPLVLMMIYCGARISELLNLKKEDVHLDERWFQIQASKTPAGVRVVPIAEKVYPFWEAFMNRSRCEYAICTTEGMRLTYENFNRRYWKPLMLELNLKHTPHEARHTFVSQMVMKNANPIILRKIVGHTSIMSLTEKVYTHIELKELINEVNKL
ncbi:MAG: site-specific integrase [Oscillospiraceae bacterium]|nr:site-specific integrase [Oscillospiraceae bacterium]